VFTLEDYDSRRTLSYLQYIYTESLYRSLGNDTIAHHRVCRSIIATPSPSRLKRSLVVTYSTSQCDQISTRTKSLNHCEGGHLRRLMYLNTADFVAADLAIRTESSLSKTRYAANADSDNPEQCFVYVSENRGLSRPLSALRLDGSL
jgi:hypothetical protein